MLPARACRSAESSPSPGTPGLTGRDGDGSLGPAGAPSEIDPSWRRPPGSKDFDGGIDSYVSSPGGDGGGDGSDALPAFDARRLNRRFAAFRLVDNPALIFEGKFDGLANAFVVFHA